MREADEVEAYRDGRNIGEGRAGPDRRFRDLSDGGLKEKWTKTAALFFADPENPEARADFDDADAEMALRRIRPPYDAVRKDVDTLARRTADEFRKAAGTQRRENVDESSPDFAMMALRRLLS